MKSVNKYLIEDAKGNPIKADTAKEVFDLIASNHCFVLTTDRFGYQEIRNLLAERITHWWFSNRCRRYEDGDVCVLAIGEISKPVLNRHLKVLREARKKRLDYEKQFFPSLNGFDPNQVFTICMHFYVCSIKDEPEWINQVEVNVTGLDTALKVFSLFQAFRRKIEKNPSIELDLELRFTGVDEEMLIGEGDYILQVDGKFVEPGYGEAFFWEHSRLEATRKIKTVIKPILDGVIAKAESDEAILKAVFGKGAGMISGFYRDAINLYDQTIKESGDRASRWEKKHQLVKSGRLFN